MGLPSRRSAGAPQARSCRAGQRHVPDLRGHTGLPQFAGQLRLPHLQAPPFWKSLGRSRECLFARLAMRPTQRGGQLVQRAT